MASPSPSPPKEASRADRTDSERPAGVDEKEPANLERAWPLIRRFWGWMRPHAKYIWIGIAIQLVATPVALVAPLVIQLLVDSALDQAATTEVLRWGVVLVVLGVVSVSLSLGGSWAVLLFQAKLVRDLRFLLFSHMQGLSWAFHANKETGELMSRQIDDVRNLKSVMADAFVTVAVAAVRGLACLGMLFWLEWRLATGGMLLILVILAFVLLVSGRLRKLNKTALERWTETSRAMHQGLSGHNLVQATASEKREALRFTRVLHTNVRAYLSRDLFSLLVNQAYGLITGTGPALIILGGVYLIVTTDFGVGGLFAFFMYLTQLFRAVRILASFNTSFQGSLASLERIFEILDTEPGVASPPTGAVRHSVAGALSFEGVSFSYEEGLPVLQDIDLTIEPMTRVALVGQSGAGKTTLATLVPRFYDPDHGQVRVDGHDLRNLDLRHYRSQVGFVPQDIFLFDRSVAENIAAGVRHATDESIQAAAEAANATEFINAMPEGFDTLIGERGVRLSGGQRQRLAIAREILRDPAILILDEATSALDSESEQLIQEALDHLLEGRTSIVIAHRLSTVIGSDLIVVLDEGRIVERGRHEDLLAQNGRYSVLYHTQFKEHISG